MRKIEIPITAAITRFMSYRIRTSRKAVKPSMMAMKMIGFSIDVGVLKCDDTGCLHGKGEQEGSDLHGEEQEGHCEEGDEVFCIQTGISGQSS